jgi:hypothetical protein
MPDRIDYNRMRISQRADERQVRHDAIIRPEYLLSLGYVPPTPGHRTDAIDTATVQRELTYLRARRAELYRPLIGETVLIADTSVPPWAETIEVQVTRGMGERARPMGRPGAGRRGTPPTVKKESTTFKQWSFVTGYEVWDDDLERAQRTGINVRDSAVATNMRLYNEHIDELVCDGDTTLGIPSLCSRDDVVGENSEVFLDPTDKVATGSASYAWAIPSDLSEAGLSAMFWGMVKDVCKVANQIKEQSKQNFTCDTMLLPDTWLSAASQVVHPFLGKTAMEQVRAACPDVRRWLGWWKLRTAGNGGGGRIVGFDSTNDRVARLCISRRLTDDQPQRLSEGFGIYVPQRYTVAGVLVEQPQGIAYLDETPH